MNPLAAMLASLGQTAALILPLVLLAAAAGIPVTAALIGLPATKRTKIFRNKLGQHAATLALILTAAGIAALAGAYALPKSDTLPLAAAAKRLAGFSLWLAALFALGAVLAIAYRATWQTLKQSKPVHAAIGVSASLAMFAAAAVGLGAMAAPEGAAMDLAAAARFIPPLGLAESVLACVSLAGALCVFYLIARRNADDFGRDYYIYTVALCLRLAALPAIAVCAVEFWRYAAALPALRPAEALSPLVWLWPVGLVCALAAAAAWLVVARGLNPLRFKELIAAAFVLVYAGISVAVCANAALSQLP